MLFLPLDDIISGGKDYFVIRGFLTYTVTFLSLRAGVVTLISRSSIVLYISTKDTVDSSTPSGCAIEDAWSFVLVPTALCGSGMARFVMSLESDAGTTLANALQALC